MFLLYKAKRSSVLCYVAAICTVAFWSVAVPVVVRAGALQAAPENPEFTQYIRDKNAGLLQSLSDDGHPLSFMPSPVKRAVVKTKAVLTADAELPAVFDLRTVDGVTAVKDQGSCGSCWTFATFASMESFLKYKHSLHQTYDFSEEDLNRYHGFDLEECEGGTFDMATAYLTRWDGPVSTSDVAYPYSSNVLGATSGVKIRRHVQNVWYVPERSSFTDNDAVKQAVRTYGAVAVSFYYASAYYNGNSAAYYCSAGNTSNHAVAIVGWDDNYARTNFPAGRQPPGNGAFIVKNSWGTSWGEAGFFYLSYYDRSLSVGVSFNNAEVTSNYKRIYKYDPLGWTTSLGYSSTTAWFANVFEADAKAYKIKAVSVYSPVPNATYQLYIYSNLSGTNPRNGVLVKTRSGTLAKAGHRTVRTFTSVEDPPTVVAGARFSVVVKLTTPAYNYPIPIEKDYSGYSSAATASAGQSYVSQDGETWYDLTKLTIGSTSLKKANVCLKAFGG